MPDGVSGFDFGQPDRDLELLWKYAERFAVIALANLPADYESRKRIITNAILSALTSNEIAGQANRPSGENTSTPR